MASSSRKKGRIVRLVIALILITGLLVSLIWTDQINRKLGLIPEESEPVKTPAEEVTQTTELGEDLNVHFVDVGQGDACIIEFPDNKTMLIDAADTKKANKEALLNYIDEHIKDVEGNTINWFDYAVLTHPDSDHCGGMADVLKEYPAKTFYRPNVYSNYKEAYNEKAEKENKPKLPDDAFVDPATDIKELGKDNIKDTKTYDEALQAAYEGEIDGVKTNVIVTDATNKETSLIAPDLPESDPNYYTFTFYAPLGAVSYGDWNDYSPIMILEYHGKRFMLSGDAEKNAEADFVAEALKGEGKYEIFDEDFTVDVFKLGHHGSSTSSSEAFINVMTTPESCQNVIAIVSCGEGNSYGHPHDKVLERLKNLGFKDENILRTDTRRNEDKEPGSGTITVLVKGTKDENGLVSYSLYVGDVAVKSEPGKKLTVNVYLTWLEIVIIACIAVVIIFLILPEIRAWFKKVRGR